MQATDPALARLPRARRRLRTRIILSFVLFGFALTTLIAATTVYMRNRVESNVLGAALEKNNNMFAEGFYRNPTAVGIPFEKIQGRQFSTRKLDKVPPEWRDLSNGVHDVAMPAQASGEPRVYKLAVRKDPDYWFFLAYDIAEERESQQKLNSALVASVGIFTVFSLLIGWWSAARVMSPVTELAQRLRRSGTSSSPEALAPHFPEDEVGELAKALDDYAARLTEVVQRDREFNADVSHELRTPLAVIRGAVELLLARPELDERTRTRLSRIQRAELQCTDLISALLLLSRNERAVGQCDAARVAQQLLESHRAQLAGKPVELRLEGAATLPLDVPESVLSVALGNLIGNAVKYTPSGEVVVRVLANAVEVSDSGPGLSAEDAAKLFTRGYRGTHAGHSQGGGIGLSIVRRLCALYAWDVRVRPGDGRGVVATLTFG
ncbi:sensor histidine kinase [Thermomonas fusca]|uniref:histidine kinase n=1 Tax=Thermomonas fusca TaxID=215690 RepID=A0A5R9PD14_9GAMM|nr:HAMP domain-containing sensor histidine kinase [Thermomonas fusca]TLX21106.1 HAMP domain-containing histidine kinase [Thermomonas fusca]